MRILVTGGAGFVGGHVVESLTAAGHQVRAFDALLPAAHGPAASWPQWLPSEAERVTGDVRDATAVVAALADVDAVCHQAAMVGLGVDLADLPAYVGVNDLGTAVLLAAMAATGVRRLVLASSMVVYGEGSYVCPRDGVVRPPPRSVAELTAERWDPGCPRCGGPLRAALVDEGVPVDPRSVYAATKVAQEHLAAAWARESGGLAVALRYHNVYGPRMPRDTPYAGVAALFRTALEHGLPPRVFEDGEQRRDFVHARDVARANLLAVTADRPRGFAAYNVASGEARTVGQLAEALATAFGGPAPVVTAQFRLGDVRHVLASPARAVRELGFTAAVSFDEGMREFATAPLR